MKLQLKILNGLRTNTILSLNIKSEHSSLESLHKIYETESFEISYFSAIEFQDIKLSFFDNELEYSECIAFNQGYEYIWRPKYKNFALFLNYFGQANITLLCTQFNNIKDVYVFEDIDILTTKASAEKIRKMINYLLNEDCQEVFSPLKTSRSSFSLKQGSTPPEIILEKYENILHDLEGLIAKICNKAIYKLIQANSLKSYKNQNSNIDDNSIAWLLSNPDRMYETCHDDDDAILNFKNSYYAVDIIEVSDPVYNFDIYENRIILGFLDSMISTANAIILTYNNLHDHYSNNSQSSYVSLKEYIKLVSFEKNEILIKKFQIVKEKILRLKNKLKQKFVNVKPFSTSPIITEKVRNDYNYLKLFKIIIQWYHLGKVDWEKFDLLLSINNIAKLFELYGYFQIKNSLSRVLNLSPILFLSEETDSVGYLYNLKDCDISLLYEPKYWMVGHAKSSMNQLVNIEGLSFYNGIINQRSRTHHFSHRCPDFMIVFNKNNHKQYFIIDAKYMSTINMLQREMPKLTLKYLHGLHHDTDIIRGLMLMNFGSEQQKYNFFCDEYNVFNVNKQQILGITLNESSSNEISILDEIFVELIKSFIHCLLEK